MKFGGVLTKERTYINRIRKVQIKPYTGFRREMLSTCSEDGKGCLDVFLLLKKSTCFSKAWKNRPCFMPVADMHL